MGYNTFNKLETKHPNKLLWEYAIPAIIGFLVVALYNLIDSIYIAYGPGLGEHAIGGLGIVLPIMTLISAIGLLVGTGAASRISIFLGMEDKAMAEKVSANACLLSVSLTCTFIFFVYLFINPILSGIGATTISYPFALEFLLYYLPSCIFFNLSFVLCGIMRASGYPKKSMYIMLLGVVINIILAPVFIFILQWGMKGAAIATGISSLIALLAAIYHFQKPNVALRIPKDKMVFDSKVSWSILNIGLSPFIIQAAASVVAFIINNRLRVYGDDSAIEAFTIANRLTLIIILVIAGLTQGLQPIVGYNWGAKRLDRVISSVNYAIKISICIGLAGLIMGIFFPKVVVGMFNPSQLLADKSTRVLSIITLTLSLSGIQMVISSFFQSIAMPVKSTMLSLTRQFLFLIPALMILPRLFGLDGIWVSIPVADVLSTILALIMYNWQKRQFQSIQTISINTKQLYTYK